MKLQKLGAYTAIAALIILIAIESYVVPYLQKRTAYMDDPAKTMAAALAMPTGFYVLNLLIIVQIILGFILFLALHERMQANAPYLTRIMLIAASAGTVMEIVVCIINFQGIGVLAPMEDLSAFRALISVMVGLHYASNHAFAWTVMFTGCAILKTHAFSRIIGWLFILAGIIGIPRFIAPILGPIALLPSGIATVWIVIALLREKQSQSAVNMMKASK